MNQTDIKRIDDQLAHAQRLLEKMKADLANFESEVESETKELDKRFDANESHLKGRAGWLGLVRKH